MNLLITNSVPLNGGDEALLRAVIESITARWSSSKITVLCSNLKLCQQQLPDLELAPDLEFATIYHQDNFHRLKSKIASKLRNLLGKTWLCSYIDYLEPCGKQDVLKLYQKADIVLSAPGGFFHDHYPIEERLRGLEVALALGKPVVLLAQSIGPFWKPESLQRVPKVFNRVSRICVRDSISKMHLLNSGVSPGKIKETADAAFLWRQLTPDLFNYKNKPVRKVALCFRVWPLGDKIMVEETIVKAEQLCRQILTDPKKELVFISTCQGISGYVDDSVLALRIVNRLPQSLQTRCQVDRTRYSPRQLIQRLGQLDAFIGMRLHGCILAMLGGTPALGLGYEPKTQEIFRQMGLEPYQVGFEENEYAWLQCTERFLADIDRIRAMLPDRLDYLCSRANENLEVVAECLTDRMTTSV